MFRKPVIDLSMSWYRLFLPCSRVQINVVAGAVTVQNTSGSQQLTDEPAALQMAISFV